MRAIGNFLNKFRLGQWLIGKIITDKQFVSMTYDDLKPPRETPKFHGGRKSNADWLLED
jgi:hypothetical protein